MIDRDSIFAAFDTETTGLSAAQGRIVEIAALKFDVAGNVIGELSQLVNPQAPIPPDAIAVHGITDETVAAMPPITEVLPQFLDFAKGENTILIAQNALFDIGFVNHEALRHDIKLTRNIILDQIDFTRQTFPGLPSYALETTCRKFGLVETQAHRAMADSVLVMRLFLHCLRQYPTVDDAMEVLNSLNHYTFGGPMVVKISEELMEVITQALETGATLEIVYAGGSKKGLPRQIVPTLLFNRDGVMFLTARCLLSDTNKHFRLDRIKECRIAADDNF
jgi:DNA polymerase III epsilon subunit family exonuclease